MSRRSPLRILAFFLAFSFTAPVYGNLEQEVFNLEGLHPFDGNIIHEIHITGLKWTKEKAVRWLFSQHEGDRFNADRWVEGIHKLYDTTVLYNITTRATQIDKGQIDLEVNLSDRWALMPFGILQAGGGSNNIGGGVYHANFLGYFAQASVSYSEFDHVAAYDFNIFQEFLRDTDYIWGLDVSQVGTPVSLQADNGDSLGSYLWERKQLQLLFGEKFKPKIRLFSYFELFQDRMIENDQASEAMVYTNVQYRIRPTLILGRSEWTNFLEQGQELTFAPTTANFFDPVRNYSQMVSTFKKVFLEGNTNYGLFLNAGAMTKAPIPYLFRLGGYDTVRGFSTNRAIGEFYVADSLEYRPYLTRFQTPLIGEVVMQGNVFSDGAIMGNSSDLASTRRVNANITLLSAGTGLRFNFMRFAGAIVRVDFAKTITPGEGWGASIGVGQFF